ncbi:MAG: aminopeptidase PepB [Enterobacter hormaechei]|nr:aminopeptidase PepB [Enterobacter hormaechei]
MTEAMKITLSTQPADSRWGEKATYSINNDGITLHLTGNDDLGLIQRAARKIDGLGIKHVSLEGEGWDTDRSWAFWAGYKGPKGTRKIEWANLDEAGQKELESRLKIIDWVRDTINAPAEELGPEQLAQRAVDLLCGVAGDKMSYRITKGEDLREQNYMGIHTVGRGSERPPVLLALDYNPTGDKEAPVFACLVGKGITFDTGGYSLKQSAFMDSMKSDMGGAATITGALAFAITRGLNKRVKLYLCCADNMVSGNAFKLGDIIRYRNGKNVEVMNTDAEGRLVLADGLIDASAQKPELIIDMATLTGAAKTALGNDYHALFSFDDKLADRLLASAAAENEPFWRLPLAAGFLSHFVENYHEGWLHIDCSATYRKAAVEQWSAGATGLGVRTVANLLTAE